MEERRRKKICRDIQMTHISNWTHPDVTAILENAQKPVNKQNYVTEVFVYVQIMP